MNLQTMMRALSLAVLLAFVGQSAAAEENKTATKRKPAPTPPVAIRLQPKPGQLLRYQLNLAGQIGWMPPIEQIDGGQMETGFTFTLHAKKKRPNGDWTFDLVGEHLKSAGMTRKGRYGIEANRNRSKVKVNESGDVPWRIKLDESPLEKPMTLTLSPRGEFRFGTGLAPLAVFMLPHIDHQAWALLTTAPEQPVAPGDTWNLDLQIPLPETKGKPLDVKVKWTVLGRRIQAKRDVLDIGMTAKVRLGPTTVLLKNGDEISIPTGNYTMTGKAVWDVAAGFLHSAGAEQSLLLTSDRPVPRKLIAKSRCGLQWTGMQMPGPSKP